MYNYNKLCDNSEAIAHLKRKFLITKEGVEERGESKEERLSSFGDSEETDPRVQEVG